MMRGTAVLCAALLLPPAADVTRPVATDTEVLKGIEQVEQGEYDLAIYTLDTASRRLAKDPDKVDDLSAAYLYLGIAYFGKGHEAAAKASFREAVLQLRELSLSAEQYPPKIIDLFEAARAEAATQAASAEAEAPAEPAAAPAAAAAAAEPEEKKGGSKTLLLVGGGAVAVGGIALAAGGGGGGGGSATTTPTPQPTPEPTTQVRQIAGAVEDPDHLCESIELYVQGSGPLSATVNWEQPTELLDLYLWSGVPWDSEPAAREQRASETSAELHADVQPQTYVFDVCLGWSDCRQAREDGQDVACGTGFSGMITHP